MERYRELVSLVAGLECGLEEHSYNYLHTWAAAALGEVRPYISTFVVVIYFITIFGLNNSYNTDRQSMQNYLFR